MGTEAKMMTAAELIGQIRLTVHPSALELGPLADGITRNRKGQLDWSDLKLTRLELPASRTGFGCRWIDYDDHREALDALGRCRAAVATCESPEDVLRTTGAFYEAE